MDHDQRQQVFDEFNNNWEDICNKIQKAVEQSICSNYTLQQTIRSQSKATIESYVKECIEQTRLMVE